jgi:hypothetical protein
VSSSLTTYGFRSASGGGGGGNDCCKEGTFYITVCADGTPAENAQEVIDAYTQAQSLLPTKDNVITIILCPGEYAFTGPMVLDTEYINLVTLTGNRDAIFDRADVTDPVTISPSFDVAFCLSIETDEVFVKGIEGKVRNSPNWNTVTGGAFGTDFRLPINIDSGLTDYLIENCNGGDLGFGADLTFGSAPRDIGGTFIDCQGENYCFALGGNALGVFINCISRDSSFASTLGGGFGSGIASGTFTDCYSGNGYSFGGFGEASGIFTNCTGGAYSFASSGIASGTFKTCISDVNSFGGDSSTGQATGVFLDCRAGVFSFGCSGAGSTASGLFFNCVGAESCFGDIASGTFINCVGDSYCFGWQGEASGIFTNCKAVDFSFAALSISLASGTFTDCVARDYSFGYINNASGTFKNCSGGIRCFGGDAGTALGVFTDCVADISSFGGAGGTASGTFNYCEGGFRSFGGGSGGTGILSGNLYFCRLATGTFQTPSGGGSITLGIDGSNNIINI